MQHGKTSCKENQKSQATMSSPKMSLVLKGVSNSLLFGTTLSIFGCATTGVLKSGVYTETVQQVVAQDQIIAFGRPAQALPTTPNASMVIVGEKNSYVLTEGGDRMVSLLSNLTPENINVQNDMNFEVPNNNGYFQGRVSLSYVKLKDEFDRADYQYFLENNGSDCSTQSDERINAQRFCFNIPVKGSVYPPVSNLGVIQKQYRAFSKPYAVTFYTKTEQETHSGRGPNAAQKLVLLPFALAFDVITYPIQALGALD